MPNSEGELRTRVHHRKASWKQVAPDDSEAVPPRIPDNLLMNDSIGAPAPQGLSPEAVVQLRSLYPKGLGL
jgi:hypothetical protein